MKSILIVDDEQCVLSGLRRQLHARRGEWELLFTDGGEAALALLAERPADVLVTDMRMPGMDGAQLLASVAADHPRIARLVLSGQAETDRQIVARGCSHRYLTKPCPADQLEGAIRQALAVRAALDALDWAHGTRLWNSLPGDDATAGQLFRHLAGEGQAEEAGAAWRHVIDADLRLRACVGLILGEDDAAAMLALCGARPAIELTLALHLSERILGVETEDRAVVAAARALTLARALGLGTDVGVQAATAALLDLPAPPGGPDAGPGRREVLEFLLPIWGFPEAVATAAARLHDPGEPATGLLGLVRRAVAGPAEGPHLIPSGRR